PRPVILDTDPGIDDAVAILMLLGAEEIDLQAITVVGGNVGLRNTLRNALSLVELAGRTDVPVYAGAKNPLLTRLVTAEDIHGAGGLGNLELPVPVTNPTEGDVAEVIYRRAQEAPGELTLIAIGPLTNIARAFLAHPDLPGLLKELIIMGGSVGAGNMTLAAEFNIYVDPEAARIVFGSGVKLTMVPLDVCNSHTLKMKDIEAIEAVGTDCAKAVGKLLRYSHNVSTRLGRDGCPVYDAVTAACLLRREIFELKDCAIDLETRGRLTRGRTVVDWYGVSGDQPNCAVAVDFEIEGYRDRLIESLSRLR
ncbi:MAG: nucleoside hydrolase, partial [Clostridia bacterium]|nr:nucleoside hydrolase [Clostridia bacterium]